MASHPTPGSLRSGAGVYTQLGVRNRWKLGQGHFWGGELIFLHYFHKGQTCDPQIGCGQHVRGRLGKEGQGTGLSLPPGPAVSLILDPCFLILDPMPIPASLSAHWVFSFSLIFI